MEYVTAELIYQNYADVGEGCLWDEKNKLLYWVDIHRAQLYVFNPDNHSNMGFDIKEHVGTVVLREKGGVLLALKNGFAHFDLKTGKLKKLIDPESHLPNNRFNDGKCDPQGRFWAGTMAYDIEKEAGSLYCLDTHLNFTKKIQNVTISNGLVWNQAQNRFYHIDSTTYSVDVYNYFPETGEITNKRTLRKLEEQEGMPDGMAIDAEDHLWVALFGGGKVIRLDPKSGKTVFEVIVPGAQKTTSCALGGLYLDELYITSASNGVIEKEWKTFPHSGGLFRAKVPFKGVVSHRFKG